MMPEKLQPCSAIVFGPEFGQSFFGIPPFFIKKGCFFTKLILIINYTMKNKRVSFLLKKSDAFTLTEMLVVLIIIGILVLLALPSLLPLITKTKSTEAKIQLQHIYTLEKSFFFETSKYSTDPGEISYEQQKLTTDGGQANYKIEITEASASAFKAKATSVVDFDGDGVYNVWEIDQNKNLREITKD